MSCTEIQRLLKLASKSKDEFLKAFRKFGQTGGMQVYIQILSGMEEAVAGGDVSSFKAMSEAVQWIHSDTPAETLAGYCSHADNPLRDTSFVILACKHNSVDTLRYLLGNSDKTSQDITPGKLDDEGHNVTYYAIRSGNVELLEMVINEWLGGYFADHPDEMEQALSVAYEELKLKNVLLSDEMKFFVQTKLLNLRFFSKVKKANTSPGNILERIHLVLEKTRTLRAEFSLAAVDDKFIYITLFVVQNIHILKQQLKSTYDVLPWEEMEFCLVSFISAHTKRQELNIFVWSVLSKGSILEYLDHFSNLLGNLIESIKISSLYSLGKPIRLNRDEVIADIVNRNPSFCDLYSTYQEIRDVYSLQIMKRYIDAALLAECGTREGQLTIKRTLQVMGEHLKNSLESPKLSEDVSELLLLSAPRETRKILTNLRNSLSKAHFFQDAEVIEECKLYANIQNDINKVGLVISDILLSKKMKKIMSIWTNITECNSLDEANEILEVFQDVNLDFLISNNGNQIQSENERIAELINEINNKIVEKTDYEKVLFNQIDGILHKSENYSKDMMEDYNISIARLKRVSHCTFININQSNLTKANTLKKNKCFAEQILRNLSAPSNLEFINRKLLRDHLLKFYNTLVPKAISEIADQIHFLLSLANYSCDSDNLPWIDEFRKRLREYKPKKSNIKGNNDDKTQYRVLEDHFENQLKKKLSDLGDIISAFSLGDKLCKNFSVHGDNHKTKFVLEMILLDILSILDSSNCLANNALFLDDSAPLLSGKCLRNHLAHGNALFDLMFPDILITLLLNARSLTENTIINFSEKIGNVVAHDVGKLKQKYDRDLQIISQREEIATALTEGNLVDLKRCLKEGADTNFTNIHLQTSFHLAAQGPNLEIVKFLFNGKVKTAEQNIAGQTPLHVAATHGRANIVQFLVNTIDSPINVIDNVNKTPLHCAAQNGHRETVEMLLSLGASHIVKDMEGNSPVHCAVENNHIDVVKVLLRKDVNVDINEHNHGLTCLHVAANYGHVELIQYLLHYGAAVNAKTLMGETPLHLAAFNGHLEVVNALINKGAQVNPVTSEKGYTPLHFAVEHNHEDIAKILLEHGAFVNIGNQIHNHTPLHWAARNGCKRIVNLLIEYKANVDAVKYDGATPLLYASARGHLEVVELLIQNGALKDSTHNDGRTALHLSIICGHNDIVRYLIERGFNIHIEDKRLQTPLHLAAECGDRGTVDMLLAEGADVKSASDDGSTPLHFSARNGNEAASEALIKMGAPLNAVNLNNLTPLHEAVQMSHIGIIKLLVGHAADVNAKNKYNNTPLHIGCFLGHSEAVDVLIKNNAKVDAETSAGDTPLDLAVEGNHKAVVEILIKHNAFTSENISTALCRAVKNNYGDLVKILIEKGADVNIEGGKPLQLAILAGYRGIVEVLLKNKNINIDVKNQNGFTLLHLAARNGNWNIGKALIKKGAKIDQTTSEKVTPLSIAVSSGHKEFVDMFMANGANVNAILPENTSLLHIAVSSGHPGIVETLLSLGANHNLRDDENRTALELAVGKAQLHNVEIFFQHRDININERGSGNWTLLHIAAQSGYLESVKFLVKKNANIDAKNMLGSKPIHIAAEKGFVKIVEFFLEYAMSIGDEGAAGNTLLHYAALGGHAEVAQCLIGRGADINAVDRNGMLPIHLAAKEGRLEVLNILLQNSTIYDSQDKFGNKPAHLTKNRDISKILVSTENIFKAVKMNDVSGIESLIKDGAPVNARSADKSTLLHLVCWKGYEQACNVLLKNKANPNVTGKGGNTPLHYAVKFSHFKIVQSLLNSDAKYNITTDNGQTPLDFAKHVSIIGLLKLVGKSFRKVKNGDTGIINDLKKVKDMDNIKAVMRARNVEGKSLVVVAIDNDFPKVDVLKQIMQKNITLILVMVEVLIGNENFTEALRLLKLVLDERRAMLGEDNPGTLDVQESIASILFKQCKYPEALELQEEVYRKRLEAFGPNNKDSLRMRSDIALTLHQQGRNQDAVDILQEVYGKQRKILSDNHLDVLNTRVHMALSLNASGKYEEALKMNYENYEKSLKLLGAKDPCTLNTHHDLAIVLSNLGRHDEAFVIFQQIHEAKNVLLGPNHSETLKAFHNMAGMLGVQQKPEALKLLQEVLANQRNVLGSKHLDTLNTQNNLGLLYLSQNKIFDAVRAFKAGTDQRKAISGTDHPKHVLIDKLIQGFNKYAKISDFDIDRLDNCQLPVITAACENNIALLESLIQNGSDVNTADAKGRTPLHFAASKGHLDIVKVLLKRGADATAVTIKGNTPLHTAALRDCVQISELLLQNVRETKQLGFNDFINAKTVVGEASALHVACKKGSIKMVKYLLKHGARYNPADRAHSATPQQYLQSPDVTYLLQFTRELFECAERGNMNIIKKLSVMETDDLEAVLNARDEYLQTALQVAIVNKHIIMASSLTGILKEKVS